MVLKLRVSKGFLKVRLKLNLNSDPGTDKLLNVAVIERVVCVGQRGSLFVLTTRASVCHLSKSFVFLYQFSQTACIRFDVILHLIVTKGFSN